MSYPRAVQLHQTVSPFVFHCQPLLGGWLDKEQKCEDLAMLQLTSGQTCWLGAWACWKEEYQAALSHTHRKPRTVHPEAPRVAAGGRGGSWQPCRQQQRRPVHTDGPTACRSRAAPTCWLQVDQQTYKVDMSSSKPGDTLRCCFSTTRDLLYVLLPREVSLSFELVCCASMAATGQMGRSSDSWWRLACSQCCSEPGRPLTSSTGGVAQLYAVVEAMLPR